MNKDTLYLIHIQECIGKIFSYTSGMKENNFLSSHLVQDAVLRNLQILAESTQRLSEEYKVMHSDIEWHKIAGLRNILVHDYLGVDMATVWAVIHNDLPQIIKIIVNDDPRT